MCTIDTRVGAGMVAASRAGHARPSAAGRRRGATSAQRVGPAGDLAVDEAVGPPEVDEVAGGGVEQVQVGHGVDEGEADAAADVGVARPSTPGTLVADHLAAAPLHDEEVGADAPSWSSQNRYARGARSKSRHSRDSTRNSRFMSWAPGAITPNGGRRSTSSVSPKRSR